jgi:hypothetical protein
MNLDLAVIGRGAVTPAGLGMDALQTGRPHPVPTAEVRRPDRSWPVLRVDVKALARWQREPRLRRSSSITLFLIEAAEQALAGVSAADRAATGLIVAFSTGCLVYSHRFFEDIVLRGQRLASPALFPETVFNSPGSHVASTLKLSGAVYALVGDETAWVAALQTASVWLRQERVRQVLVLGAEEFDPLVLDACVTARWLRPRAGLSGFIPSEGAAALLVRRAVPGDRRVIVTSRDGWVYRTPREAATAARELFRELDPALSVYATAGRTWLAALEKKMFSGRPVVDAGDSPYLGEASSASAGWNTLRALDHGDGPLLLPIWGLNHQLALLRLEARP